jgi:hypothetical protein
LQRPIEPRSEYGKAAPESTPEPAHFSTGLGEQIRQQQQSAEQAQLHGYIDQVPNLSAAQRQWLHMNPHGVYRFDLLHGAHTIAQQRNIAVDSPEYFHFLSAMLNTYGHLPPQQPAQMQPAPASPMPPMPAHTHIDVEKVESPESEPEQESVAVHHMAPVSHDSGHYAASGEYEPGDGSRVTLSKAEREHAEAAHVSVEEYAKQKLKMLKLKKAKVIRDE